MAVYKFEIQGALVRLSIMDDPNAYRFQANRPSLTITNIDIARKIREEGSELKVQTILSIIDLYNKIERDYLLSGYMVQDNNFHYALIVKGIWEGPTANFDPAKHHLAMDVAVTADMRKAFNDVKITPKNVKIEVSVIGVVRNMYSQLADNTAFLGEDFALEGGKIKITPENEITNGVFFTPETGGTPIRVNHPLVINDPSRVVVRVPSTLSPGKYRVHITTNYTAGGIMLKTARTIAYPNLITVGPAGSGGSTGGGGGIGNEDPPTESPTK